MKRKTLVDILLAVREPGEVDALLKTLLTEKELVEIHSRIEIISRLEKKEPQHMIAESLGVGIATVTRGAHVRKAKHYQKVQRFFA